MKLKRMIIYLFLTVSFMGNVMLSPCSLIECEEEFERNPDLEVIKKNTGSPENDSAFYLPIYANNGKYIYYLKIPELYYENLFLEISEKGGGLWRIDLYDFSEKEILKGEYRAFDISSDNKSIVVVEGNGGIKITDTSGNILYALETSQDSIIWVKFSHDGDKIYYAAKDSLSGYYRINLDGSEEELVRLCENPKYFELTKDDSLYDELEYPSFNPLDDRYVIGVYSFKQDVIETETDLILIDRVNKDTIFLNAMPYEYTKITYPSWSPDGKDVIFSCKGVYKFNPPTECRSEIWILKNVK